ncbi:hypothetical protein [Ornithinimicrobium kibberense]|uniref:hypothetical protein n=1 Tax=Ornithinimicrobium kibberense TaxID=282060 RepID=UPI00360EF0FD
MLPGPAVPPPGRPSAGRRRPRRRRPRSCVPWLVGVTELADQRRGGDGGPLGPGRDPVEHLGTLGAGRLLLEQPS